MDAVSILILLSVSGWAVAGYAWLIRGVDKYNAGYIAGRNDSQEVKWLAALKSMEGEGDE
jgi:hypothetical protein